MSETTNELLTSEALDDAEQEIDSLIRRKRLWGISAVIWFIIWLLIIMYILYPKFSHQDIVKPPSEPEVTSDTEPTVPATAKVIPDDNPPEEDESIQIAEFNIRADKISPIYEGGTSTAFVDGVPNPDVEKMLAYTESCSLSYIVEEGDNNFVAKRKSGDSAFVGVDYPFKKLTGGSQTIVDGGAVDTEADRKRIEKHAKENLTNPYIVMQKDRYTKPNQIVAAAIVLKDVSVVPEGIEKLKTKLNDLHDNGLFCDCYSIGGMSLTEFATFIGECFGTEGYLITNCGGYPELQKPDTDLRAEGMIVDQEPTSYEDSGDVFNIFMTETDDGAISIEGDMLESNDTVIFFPLDCINFTQYTTAMYSQIQAGTYDGKVYSK